MNFLSLFFQVRTNLGFILVLMTVNAQKSPSQGLTLLSVLNPATITEEDALKEPQRLEFADRLMRKSAATVKKKATTVATRGATIDNLIFLITLGIVKLFFYTVKLHVRLLVI